MIIVISGLIGVGKTSLCEAICKDLGARGFYEPVESNEFLNPYLADHAKYSFGMQMNLLYARTDAFEDAVKASKRHDELCICDRSMYEDWAFADVQHVMGYMDDLHFKCYEKWHKRFVDSMPLPDLILNLKASLETIKARQVERNREGEDCYDETYNRALMDAYDRLMPRLACKCPVVDIDAEKSKSEVLEDALNAINRRRLEFNLLKPVYHGGY